MRARAAFLAGAGSAALLSIGWNASLSLTTANTTESVPAAASTSGAATSQSSNGASTPTPSASGAPADSASAAPAPAPAPAGPADGSYQGQAIGYEFGTVQVSVVFSGGQITDVQNIVAEATKGRGQAFPLLLDEVLQAQSAHISNISGATYTTMAYAQAVQSALDVAGFTG